MEYSEHTKLLEIVEYSQEIYNFLQWAGQRELRLCSIEGLEQPLNKLLAQYFDIDLGKLEAEKRQMLEELRDAKGI